MKKALILGLMALTATFASALTVSWTSSTHPGATSAGQVAYPESGTGLIPATSVVAVITSATLPSASTNQIKFAMWSGGNAYFTLGTDGNLTVTKGGGAFDSATLTTQSSYTVSAGETYVLTALFTNAGTTTTINFYVNDQLLATATNCTGINGLNLDGFTSETDLTAYNGELTQAQLKYLAEQKTSMVPEPTVLALLALGVAGLALKRRV